MDCPELEDLAPPSREAGRPLDYITVSLIAALTVPFIFGNVVMIFYRHDQPVRAKSVVLTVLSSLGGFIWLFATLVVNNHFDRPKDTIWTICPLWTFWLQATFGFALWLNCFILRLLNLHFILIRAKGPIKSVVFALTILLSPIIIYSVLATVFKASRFKERRDGRGDCNVERGWSIALLILLPLYFLGFIGLAISLRNIRPEYNEFRLIRNGGIISFFLFLLSLVTFQTNVYHEVTGRCFLALAVSGAVFYYFWARNWEVVYNMLFNRSAYITKFRATMNSIPSSGQLGNPNPLESLYLDARDQVDTVKGEVEELERALADLQKQRRKEWRFGGNSFSGQINNSGPF